MSNGVASYKGENMNNETLIGRIESKIFQIRGKRVMFDKDLAELYCVETKQLTRQVRRNVERFPDDFMFRLTNEGNLRCQFGTSSYGGSRYAPHVFTEQGVAMLSSALNSRRAISVNIQIMRAFVKLSRIGATYPWLRRKIEDMENKYDAQFGIVFEAIKKLLEPPPEPLKRRIGFHHD